MDEEQRVVSIQRNADDTFGVTYSSKVMIDLKLQLKPTYAEQLPRKGAGVMVT